MVEKDNVPGYHRNRPQKFSFLDKAYEPEPDPTKPKPLGYMNGWGDKENYPKEYMLCVSLHHIPTETTIGKCRTESYCSICNITWAVDSSD